MQPEQGRKEMFIALRAKTVDDTNGLGVVGEARDPDKPGRPIHSRGAAVKALKAF